MALSDAKSNKQKSWQKLYSSFKNLSPQFPIEPAILETVVAMNAMGFYTVNSCEGHLNRPGSVPYVAFSVKGIEKQKARATKLIEKVRELDAQGKSEAEIRATFAEAEQVQISYEYQVLREQQRMLYLLADFYQSRTIRLELQLIFLSIGVDTHLRSQGSKLLPLYPVEEHPARLEAFRQEMNAFALYLKNCYFQES